MDDGQQDFSTGTQTAVPDGSVDLVCAGQTVNAGMLRSCSTEGSGPGRNFFVRTHLSLSLSLEVCGEIPALYC